ncbi:unnamed protein product [Tuber melanosporum]|jgi:NAD(P)-dependent dehydrogenase (short-subunit alcohol dehydrogenase family)|uniref:(Perigord truffle) hypothetical protein n=1 Tax=Tuber melanosporum (strain Mel28) TaxID=656061 RepID=D5GPY3_TUBMM|nr:uncharacterized protein GSTUM_00012089001 [Tuber melanosporum]CAZ86576.1 unnamed protein product [Tuber melanosporum]
MAAPRVWLVTGTSSGFGNELVHTILKNGHKVVAAGRNTSRLTSLKEAGAATTKIDQNEPLDILRKQVEDAITIYGHIDVIVLNAAYVTTGTLEERTPEESLAQYHTNVFGILNLYRAILPHFRVRKAGIIATVGSMGASMTDPLIGLYHSSKAAVRNLSLTLDNEVKPFGIKTCLIEPGYFRTNLLSSGTSFQLPETKIEAYAEINEKTKTFLTERDRKQSGDPKRGAQVIFDVLTSSGCARGREVPKTLALGSDAVKCIIGSNEEFNKRVEEWKSVSESTDFPKEEQHY